MTLYAAAEIATATAIPAPPASARPGYLISIRTPSLTSSHQESSARKVFMWLLSTTSEARGLLQKKWNGRVICRPLPRPQATGDTQNNMIRRLSTIILMATACAAAQPVVNRSGVVNAASYAADGLPNAGITQGSMFLVFGKDLGPASLVKASSYPLPGAQGLAGTSIRVTVGSTSVDALMVYTSAGQVAAILPSRTPPGAGTLRVTYNGQTSSAAPIRVVRGAFGAFTLSQNGTGPAVIQNVDSPTETPVNTLYRSARPGQYVILWGTGLGPVQGNEAAGPVAGEFAHITEVYVGTQRANVYYAGRSGCCVGLDQVVFQVPAGVEGCYVSVAVAVNGVLGNVTSMAVAPGGGTCSDPLGLSAPELDQIRDRGAARLGTLNLSRVTSTGASQDTATVAFMTVTADQLMRSNVTGMPSPGSCMVVNVNAASAAGTAGANAGTPLNAGPALTLSGPRGAQQMAAADGGSYAGKWPSFLDPGSYRLEAPHSGSQVGAFQTQFDVPQALNWTNAAQASRINPDRELTVTWTGGDANGLVSVLGLSGDAQAGVVGTFMCTARASAGQFSVPAWIISQMPSSAGSPVLLSVAKAAQVGRFQSAGVDFGFVTYVGGSATVASFQSSNVKR